MAFTFNPVLSEIQSHLSAMSPSAQAAVKTANPALATPTTPAPTPPEPGMLLSSSSPTLPAMPGQSPTLITGPNKGQAMLSTGESVPRGTVLGERAEQGRLLKEGSGISQIDSKIQHSRLGEAHPLAGKLLGGLAQGAATLGDIGLSAVAPEIAINTPGTEYHHQALVNQESKQNTLANEDAQKQAQAEEENAQGDEAEARAEASLNPPEKPHAAPKPETWKTLFGGNGQIVTAPNGKILQESSLGNLRYGDLPEGTTVAPKPTPEAHDAYHEWLADPTKYQDFMKAMASMKPSEKGAYGSFGPAFLAYRLLNSAYSENPALLPVLAPMLGNMLSSAGGGNASDLERVLSQVPAGQPEDENGTPIGLRQPGAPTGTTRSRGQFAGEVLPTMGQADKEIDALKDKLGPFSGRYSDLITSKIGAYGPEFSALQTDLHNIATGWGRLHGNSVETMKQFYNDLDASKDPANLKAKLQRYEEQAEIYKRGGEGKPVNETAPFSVPAGAPAAPKEDGRPLLEDGKKIAVSKGGKWVNP